MKMTHPVTLNIPDHVYIRLSKLAQTQGRPVEEVALEMLSDDEKKPDSDPLDEFIGAFQGDVPDWAENHDKYLGEELYREMLGENK